MKPTRPLHLSLTLSCRELAQCVLQHVKDARPEDVQELAEAIERLCLDMVREIKGGA